ncbi:hypothetical protein OsI_05442 [Oryza sativa Indica Group]|uniref:Uncharacterized protein n=1 Tax=Oryza sativa subsp. indica TaxID=39946 RepID=B8AA83_ORYSI|nr:hypothetical protein OsI_05442 [Oryza sativa Indica Group]
MASCMSMVSPDILPTTSPVLVYLTKKAISCLRMVLRHRFRILAACRSPGIIQHVSSGHKIIQQVQLCNLCGKTVQ